MSIFKAYDIRGTWPDQVTEETARRIGAGLAKFLGATRPTARRERPMRLVVGRDMRTMAPRVQAAVIDGILSQGCDVVDIGLASTPMGYYAIGTLDADGGCMVTASHNPKEYIGFKLCREEARPLSGDSGLKDVERMVLAGPMPAAGSRGRVETRSVKARFVDHICGFASGLKPLKMVVDYANGMGAAEGPDIFRKLPALTVVPMFEELDGTFPNHEANPLKESNLDPLRARVEATQADLGIAFDGDADRCAFVDEKGRTVHADLITAILARDLLARSPGAGIIYDLRSSKVVPEEIRRLGGRPVRERVGHSFMKETMRKEQCIGGGELSGHFYFAENFYTDCGILACIKVLNQLGAEGKSLKTLADGLRRYATSGEINFQVEDKAAKIRELERKYAAGRIDWLDGITVEFPDWWFNVRPSNTEPYLRLSVEAQSQALLESRKRELFAILGEPH